MSNGHDTWTNFNEDDTVSVGCHTCNWVEAESFEDEQIAQVVLDIHSERPLRHNPLNEGLTGGRLVDAQLADMQAQREGFDPWP